MTLETFLLWVVIGAVAGFLANAVVKSGYSLGGDIIIGVVGAFIGGWLFQAMRWHAPIAGIAGTVVVAFIGAVILLAALRMVRSARGTRRA
ncbi:MAG: GlsB/YeaQ/YmgE family stress response membrane protein [Myxococcaceae bacterium]